MSAKDYELLKKKSAAAGLSANAWLMAQLATNRPVPLGGRNLGGHPLHG